MLDRDVLALDRCIEDGGVAIFPTDTVYGLGCDPTDEAAMRRLFLLKGRDAGKPAAVMFFSVERLLADLPNLQAGVMEALAKLLPGPVTAVLAVGVGEFPLAARDGKLGVRVPRFEGGLAPMRAASCSVLQSSANLAGDPDPQRLDDIPRELREAVNFQLDGGELPGVPSTVVDLSRYGSDGRFEILREGAVSAGQLRGLL